jgi:hypothetical protein
MRRAWVMLLVLLCWAAMARADVPPPWSAQESWPGGTQADARLDRTVQFWGTAIPLATVFAGIEQQTGVSVACSHAGDANERVCVNLYLNPSQPPTLRELLTQLSWVTQCTFLYLAGQPPRYSVLGSDLGRDVAVRYAQAREEQRVRNADSIARRQEQVRAGLERIDALRPELNLTPEQAIARYRGSNDNLLLALLSPERRGALSAIHALAPQQREALSAQGYWSGRLSVLPAGLRVWIAGLAKLPATSVDQAHLNISLGISYLNVSVWDPGGGGDWNAYVRLSTGSIPPDSYEGLELRAALGEPIDLDAERKRMQEEHQQDWGTFVDRNAAQRSAEVRRSAALSPATEAQLSAWVVPWGEQSVHPLWQVQEAVARTTGLHVVSDCFDQPAWPPNSLELVSPEYARKRQQREEEIQRFSQEHPAEWEKLTMEEGGVEKRFPLVVQSLTLRDLLTAMCYQAWTAPIGYLEEGAELGWEWGDAGDFLRFRSRHADVWRAALLPPAARQLLDAAFARRQEQAASGETSAEARAFPLSEQIALVGLVDDIQLRLGGLILREDPSTPTGAARAAFTRGVWQTFSQSEAWPRLLASLRDSQWLQLLGPGLEVGRDLTPEQRARLSLDRPYSASTNVRLTAMTDDRMGPAGRVDDIAWLALTRTGDEVSREMWRVRGYLGGPEKVAEFPTPQPASP